MLTKTLLCAAFAALATLSTAVSAAVISNSRLAFTSELTDYRLDTYESLGYRHGDRMDTASIDIFSNSAMSAVFGETRYTTTGFANWNIILGTTNHSFCAGCNGSFLLDFTANSFEAPGISAVGFDFAKSTNYVANVGFVDGSFGNYNIGLGYGFWGITSDLAISSLHLGLLNGGATTNGYVEIDNLTTGMVTVPEPGPIFLFGLGLVGLAFGRRKLKS